MRRWAQQLLILLLAPLLNGVLAFAAIVVLENPDFELPPSNIPSNYSTIPLLPLNASTNSIPGWSFRSPAAYVSNTSSGGPDGMFFLPEGSGSHAMYIGAEGAITQKINGTEQAMYILTFTILGAAQKNCSFDGNIIVSLSGNNASYSHAFSQNLYGVQWESHGVYLGSYGDELLDLTLEYARSDSGRRNLCRGPIFDSIILNRIADPVKIIENNLLVNGGFEMGPASPNNSFNGVIMLDTSNASRSPLIQWNINGGAKYITSNRNYIVPEGNAAIELVYGESNGIQTAATLVTGSEYKLEFFIGDANDGCKGEFVVGVLAGSAGKNFTLRSHGTGSTRRFSMSFKADSSVTSIRFQSLKMFRTRDSVDCGPVIDDVILLPHSHGLKLELPFMVLFSFLFFMVTIL